MTGPPVDLTVVSAEDGRLELATPDGSARFGLPVNDELHQALRRAAAGPPARLTPREIQERFRAGATAAAVAREAGTTEERVRRWEGPVLAERAAVVERARATRFARPPDGAVSGPLGGLVDARLETVGLAGEWDAWRDPPGTWTVQVSSPAGTAQWRLSAGTLVALDPLAEQLGVAAPHAVPAEARRPRRGSLPSWDDILANAPPPNAFPT